jgi:hypothetical protein
MAFLRLAIIVPWSPDWRRLRAIAVLGSAALCTSVPARTEEPVTAGALTRLEGAGLTVRWGARTGVDGGAFRLYGGPGPDRLRLLRETPAVLGSCRYFERTIEPTAPLFLVQLRYVGRNGDERILEGLWVRTNSLHPDEGVPSPRDPGALAVAARRIGPPAAPSRRRFAFEATGAGRLRPPPEEPPPRGLAVLDAGLAA